MRWSGRVAISRAALALALTACGKPDVTALQKLACEQAGANLDLQSVQQLDALRKALGIAPDVDPLAHCTSIGAVMKPAAQPGSANDQPDERQQDEASEQAQEAEN